MRDWSKSKSFRSFRHRNFRLLWSAALVSNLGSWAQIVAQDWLVLELTNSAKALSALMVLQALPALVLSLPAGRIADKWNRRKVLIGTNVAGMLAALTIGVLVQTNTIQLWHLWVMALVNGSAGAIDSPVRMSFVTAIVGREDLANAASLNSSNFNMGRLVGPAISGLLITAFGTGPSFIINGLSFVFVIAALVAIREEHLHQEPKHTDSDGTILEAWRYIWARPDLRAVLLTVFFATSFGLNFNFFNAMMVQQVFHQNAAVFGTMGTIVAVGTLSGALLSTRLEHMRNAKNVARGAVLFGILITVISFMPNLTLYALLLPFLGVVALSTLISANSSMQLHTDSAIRGRVLAWYVLAFSSPAGQPILGWVAETIGVRWAITVAGLVTALSALCVLWIFRGRLGRPDDYGIAAVLDQQRYT